VCHSGLCITAHCTIFSSSLCTESRMRKVCAKRCIGASQVHSQSRTLFSITHFLDGQIIHGRALLAVWLFRAAQPDSHQFPSPTAVTGPCTEIHLDNDGDYRRSGEGNLRGASSLDSQVRFFGQTTRFAWRIKCVTNTFPNGTFCPEG
jgi:hypothetical protein